MKKVLRVFELTNATFVNHFSNRSRYRSASSVLSRGFADSESPLLGGSDSMRRSCACASSTLSI
jgi:hypothetical protein